VFFPFSIGDEVYFHGGSLMQPHTFENKTLTMRPVSVGHRCGIGSNTFLLSGCTLENDVVVDSASLVLKDDRLATGTRWRGSPAQAVDTIWRCNVAHAGPAAPVAAHNRQPTASPTTVRRSLDRASNTPSLPTSPPHVARSVV
jgi:carbonic anhydrase/acetyltransferase-like protein (isoleucine patch superfamily)